MKYLENDRGEMVFRQIVRHCKLKWQIISPTKFPEELMTVGDIKSGDLMYENNDYLATYKKFAELVLKNDIEPNTIFLCPEILK